MQLDPSLIYKAAESTAQIQSPFEQHKSLMAMQDAIAKQKAQAELGAHGYDQKQTLSFLARFDPEAAAKANSQSVIASAQAAKYGASANLDNQKAHVEKLKQSSQQVDLIGKVASGITDQATYTSAMGYLRQQGVDVTDLPANYDPELVKSKAAMALDAKDKIALQLRELQIGNQADYQQGLLNQGQSRIEGDLGMRQAQLNQTGAMGNSRLSEMSRHNQAMEDKAGTVGKSSSKRVIERDGSIYIVDPETNVVSEGKTADGKDYRTPSQRKQAMQSKQMLTVLGQAKELLKAGKATSGGFQNAIAGAARFANITTDGMKDAAKLKNLSGWLTSNTPRMEGPQSDRDVKQYAEMAGMVGDEDRTLEERRAAFSSIVGLLRKYKDLNK
jgi:hypothetical protein